MSKFVEKHLEFKSCKLARRVEGLEFEAYGQLGTKLMETVP